MAPYPEWLHILSLAFLSFSFLCAAIIISDELRVPTNRLAMRCQTRLGDSRGQGLCGFFNSLASSEQAWDEPELIDTPAALGLEQKRVGAGRDQPSADSSS
jgi:hypothetical protein